MTKISSDSGDQISDSKTSCLKLHDPVAKTLEMHHNIYF